MPQVDRVSEISAKAAGVSSLTSSVYNLIGGGGNIAFAIGIYRSGGILDAPVLTVTRGADSGFFIAAQATGAGDATIEWWGMFGVTEQSAAFVVDFGVGAFVNVIMDAIELINNGRTGPDPGTGFSSDLAVTAFSASMTMSDGLGGDNGTIFIPSTNGLLFGCGGSMSALANISVASESTSLEDSIGAGATRLACAVSFMRATGGVDTLDYAASVAANTGALMVGFWGCAINGIVRCTGVLPRVR